MQSSEIFLESTDLYFSKLRMVVFLPIYKRITESKVLVYFHLLVLISSTCIFMEV